MKWRRVLMLIVALTVVVLLPRRASAQQVWAYADASYDASCTCVIGDVEYEADDVAVMDYDTWFTGEMYDEQGTFDATDNLQVFGENYSDSFEADNVTIDDQFDADADISGDIDSEWQNCVTGACGQRCTLHGGCSCPCWCLTNTCPSDYMPFDLNASNSASATPTCGAPTNGADLDTLVGEYTKLPASNYPFPVVQCSDFYPKGTGDPLEGDLVPSEAASFSSQDVTDWALFDNYLQLSIFETNYRTPVPADANLDTLAIPLTESAVFRTPKYQAQLEPKYPNDVHVHGYAVDYNIPINLRADATAWTAMSLWEAYSNNFWTSPGNPGSIGNICIEPHQEQAGSSSGEFGHLHLDVRNPCPPTWPLILPPNW